MGKRGPRAKTAEERRLSGNAAKRPLDEPAKPLEQVMPDCPPWLEGLAREKWEALVPVLKRLGRLDSNCGDSAAAYCVAWSEMITSTNILNKEGRVLKTANGYSYAHPSVAQQRSAMAALTRLSAVLGLDPSSLSRLPSTAPEEPDELDIFLASRGKDKSRFFKESDEAAAKRRKNQR
jgi:P27 family predicted phage terminase small subunit